VIEESCDLCGIEERGDLCGIEESCDLCGMMCVDVAAEPEPPKEIKCLEICSPFVNYKVSSVPIPCDT
jgi:hypothetical protein